MHVVTCVVRGVEPIVRVRLFRLVESNKSCAAVLGVREFLARAPPINEILTLSAFAFPIIIVRESNRGAAASRSSKSTVEGEKVADDTALAGRMRGYGIGHVLCSSHILFIGMSLDCAISVQVDIEVSDDAATRPVPPVVVLDPSSGLVGAQVVIFESLIVADKAEGGGLRGYAAYWTRGPGTSDVALKFILITVRVSFVESHIDSFK